MCIPSTSTLNILHPGICTCYISGIVSFWICLKMCLPVRASLNILGFSSCEKTSWEFHMLLVTSLCTSFFDALNILFFLHHWNASFLVELNEHKLFPKPSHTFHPKQTCTCKKKDTHETISINRHLPHKHAQLRHHS